jgi:hypothetical protein
MPIGIIELELALLIAHFKCSVEKIYNYQYNPIVYAMKQNNKKSR